MQMVGEYNRHHGRILDAYHDSSVTAEQLKNWETEALEVIELMFSENPSVFRGPLVEAEWCASIRLSTTFALMERLKNPNEGVTREEVAQRLSDLKKSYLYLDSISPTGDESFKETVATLHQAQIAIHTRPHFSPIGCALLLITIIFVLYLIFFR